ncbi:hypothetical protein OG436_39640 (plasmid) [Streptomyces caniferus]|uniref:hypothetical protein n=1 Tax=Streptomyces caniferus TaxID=285557 RepID=UPI002E28C2CA|nr:hypothetical protein [Streptomyces caniferus]
MRKAAKVTISICVTAIATLGMSSPALSDSPTQVDVRDNNLMSSCKKWTLNPGKDANVRCKRTDWKETNYYVTAVCKYGAHRWTAEGPIRDMPDAGKGYGNVSTAVCAGAGRLVEYYASVHMRG